MAKWLRRVLTVNSLSRMASTLNCGIVSRNDPHYITLLSRLEANQGNFCQTAQESSLQEDTIDESEDAAEKK